MDMGIEMEIYGCVHIHTCIHTDIHTHMHVAMFMQAPDIQTAADV